jgi:pantetheine-phosphate adenylyltransferase
MKICVFPGSFDPITIGHVDLVHRAIPLFDKIIVAIGVNAAKQYLFPLDKRVAWIEKCFRDEPKVEVATYQNLTADFCKNVGANYLLRGLRNASDFDYEKTISQINNIIGEGVETIFLISQPSLSHISSTIVREVIKGGADVSAFLPEEIKNEIKL